MPVARSAKGVSQAAQYGANAKAGQKDAPSASLAIGNGDGYQSGDDEQRGRQAQGHSLLVSYRVNGRGDHSGYPQNQARGEAPERQPWPSPPLRRVLAVRAQLRICGHGTNPPVAETPQLFRSVPVLPE